MKTSNNPQPVRLNNGAIVLYIPDDSGLSVVSVWFRAGARFDPSDQSGIAHLCEHLTSAQFDVLIEQGGRSVTQSGIQANAYINHETVRFLHIQPVDHLQSSLNLLCEYLFSADYTQANLKAEQRTIVNEIREFTNDIDAQLWQLTHQGLWPETGLAQTIRGQEETVTNLSLTDVKKFQAKHYAPEQAFFVISGPAEDQEAVVQQLNKLPGSEKVNNEATAVNSAITTTPQEVVQGHQPTETITVGVNFKTVNIQEEETAATLDLLMRILGGGWNSRLLQALRHEEQLVYWVDSRTQYYSDTGLLQFSFAVSEENLTSALAAVSAIFENIKTTKITTDELARHRAHYKTDFLRSNLTAEEQVHWFGSQLASGVVKPLTTDEYLKQISGIEAADVQRIAQSYIKKDNLSVVVLADGDALLEVNIF